MTFGTCYQTSRHAGGDYYDVLPLSGGRLGIMAPTSPATARPRRS